MASREHGDASVLQNTDITPHFIDLRLQVGNSRASGNSCGRTVVGRRTAVHEAQFGDTHAFAMSTAELALNHGTGKYVSTQVSTRKSAKLQCHVSCFQRQAIDVAFDLLRSANRHSIAVDIQQLL